MKSAIILAAAFSAMAATAQATVLTNGDFEAGDTGFVSDYASVPNSTSAAQYTVNTNPNAWFGLFADFGDKTTGTGNMMIVNGGTTGGATVWSQSVGVTPGTNYQFDGWIAGIFPGSSLLSLSINGNDLGQITGPATTAIWEEFSFGWASGTDTLATIALLQVSTQFGGNDYALDDLSFMATGPTNPPGVNPIPLPAAGWMLLAALGGLFGLRRTHR